MPLRGPVPPSPDPHRGQVHLLLPPGLAEPAPGVRRGVPHPGPNLRGSEQRGEPPGAVRADEQDPRAQAGAQHGAESLLREPGRRGAMTNELYKSLYELLPQITGFIYPNEIEIHWGILVVVYPYLTGIVAGAFILASLVKVFNVKEVQPLYRLSLLTITIVGIPSAFLLHGYVVFIFGSVKATPWWSSGLIPVVFLFSAIVSGIALVLILYMIASLVR